MQREVDSPGRQAREERAREAEMAARIEAELKQRFEAEVAKRVEAEMKRLSIAVFAKIEEQKKAKKHKKHRHKGGKAKHEGETPEQRAARKEARRRRKEEEAAAAMLAAGEAMVKAEQEARDARGSNIQPAPGAAGSSAPASSAAAGAGAGGKENEAGGKDKERPVKPLVLPADTAPAGAGSGSRPAAPSSNPSRIGFAAGTGAQSAPASASTSTRKLGTGQGARRGSVKGVLVGSEPIMSTHTSVRLHDDLPARRAGRGPGGSGVARSVSDHSNVGKVEAANALPRSTSVDRQLRKPRGDGAPDSARGESMRRSASDHAMRERSAVNTGASGASVGGASASNAEKRNGTGLWAQASRLMIRWENFLKL